MSNLYERIHDLCEEKGIKGAKLCTDTGISKGLLTDLKMGRRTGVSAITAQKIAAYFGVSVGYLLGEEEQKNKPTDNDGLSEGQKRLYEFCSTVPDDKVDRVLQLMKLIVEGD
jgi:transcriptional regulator with XRE-family HTH domain